MNSYIHFIRHGITEGIQKKWYYGWTDLPLVQEGVLALEKMREEGIYPDIIHADYYTSGMIRANQTLTVIYGDIPFKELPLLKELNFGNWECKTFEQLQGEPEFEAWMKNTEGTFSFPGDGESANSFLLRIKKGLKELLGYHHLKELAVRHRSDEAHSILVSHGGVIGTTMNLWFPQEKDNFWQWIPKVGRGFTVKLEDGIPISYVEI